MCVIEWRHQSSIESLLDLCSQHLCRFDWRHQSSATISLFLVRFFAFTDNNNMKNEWIYNRTEFYRGFFFQRQTANFKQKLHQLKLFVFKCIHRIYGLSWRNKRQVHSKYNLIKQYIELLQNQTLNQKMKSHCL